LRLYTRNKCFPMRPWIIRLGFLRKFFYIKLLKTLFRSANSILDVGCGRGEFIEVAQAFRKKCVGVDLDFKAILEAKKRLENGYTSLVLADMFKLPFRDLSFDAIFFSHVIEHVTVGEAVSLLRGFRRLSKLLVVVTPSYHRHFWTPGHVTAYTPKTLEKVLKMAGYRVLLVTYDKAFMLNTPMKLIPPFLVKILNMFPIAQFKVNLIAVGINTGYSSAKT